MIMAVTTPMLRVRIYTEDKGENYIVELAKFYGVDCTVMSTRGVYQGTREDSLVLEHICPYSATLPDNVLALAESLAFNLQQKEVWVSAEEITLTKIIRET